MAKLSFKNENDGKLKTFPKKQKLRDFISVNVLMLVLWIRYNRSSIIESMIVTILIVVQRNFIWASTFSLMPKKDVLE